MKKWQFIILALTLALTGSLCAAEISHQTYEDKTTTGDGGAINRVGDLLDIEDSIFRCNHADGNGDAVRVTSGTLVGGINGSIFTNNTADSSGGLQPLLLS